MQSAYWILWVTFAQVGLEVNTFMFIVDNLEKSWTDVSDNERFFLKALFIWSSGVMGFQYFLHFVDCLCEESLSNKIIKKKIPLSSFFGLYSPWILLLYLSCILLFQLLTYPLYYLPLWKYLEKNSKVILTKKRKEKNDLIINKLRSK